MPRSPQFSSHSGPFRSSANPDPFQPPHCAWARGAAYGWGRAQLRVPWPGSCSRPSREPGGPGLTEAWRRGGRLHPGGGKGAEEGGRAARRRPFLPTTVAMATRAQGQLKGVRGCFPPPPSPGPLPLPGRGLLKGTRHKGH